MNTAVGFFTLRLKLGCILYCPYKKEIKFYISREIKKTAKEEEQQRCISKWHDSWNSDLQWQPGDWEAPPHGGCQRQGDTQDTQGPTPTKGQS